jgi:hypothetical protein
MLQCNTVHSEQSHFHQTWNERQIIPLSYLQFTVINANTYLGRAIDVLAASFSSVIQIYS